MREMRLALGIRRLAVTAVLLLGACGGDAAPREQRNVLLITLDTTRADRIGCYGYAGAHTPAIDGLAATGVRFEDAYAQVPLTLPSHASLLTGAHPPSCGVRVNGAGAMSRELSTLAEVLGARGLRTGAFVAAWVLDESFGLSRGFDVYDDETLRDSEGLQATSQRPGNLVCDAALAWLEQEPDAPFFAWVHLFDPHKPYEAPGEYAELSADPYDGEIAFADAQVGRLLAWLDAKGLRERTLIVLAGDHGEAFGEHGEEDHGLLLYGTTLRVPLIMSFPPELSPGLGVAGPLGLVDVMPSILDLFGIAQPSTVEGNSRRYAWEQVRLLEDPTPVYRETEYPRLSFGWAPLRSVTTEDWHFIDAPTPELYDRRADPAEETNLAAQRPEVVAELSARLEELVARMTPREAEEIAIESDALEHMAGLGYVAGGEPDAVEGPRQNPLEMLPVLRDFKQAKRLVEAGRYSSAVRLMEPAVRKSPESSELHGILAEAYLKQRRWDDAHREFELSLRSMSSDPWKWCGLGDALRGLGRLGEAARAYERALEIAPDCGPAHSRLGVACAEQGDFERAARHHRRDMELNPDSPISTTNLAGVLPPLGRVDEALTLLRRASELDPAYAPAHRATWEILDFIGRPAEALAALRQAVASAPDNLELAGALAWTLCTARDARQRDGAEALSLAERCCRARPDQPRFLDIQAAARAEVGDFRGAAADAERALSLARGRGEAELAQQIAARLAAYRSGRAFRQ